jgi:hypothetical protein
MGLAARDAYGRVYVVRHVRVKALQSYVNVGHFMVPRLAFYATIFTAITIAYLVMSGASNMYAAAVPAGAAGIFWFEAIKMWQVHLGERTLSAKKETRDNKDFWASLAPGMAALAVFIAAAFFLFYYVEPNGMEPEAFPVDPSRIPAPGPGPVTSNDVRNMDAQIASSSHAEIVANFPMTLVTGFLFAGAIVAGFLVYLLVKYRSRESVLTLEQD